MSTLSELPDFRLEVHFARWEFAATHHLTASDAETLTVDELLALESDARDRLGQLRLGYTETWGGEELRDAVAATYDAVEAEDVLCFAGAEEAMFWALQELVGPSDHAVVVIPSYQSMETVPVAAGAEVDGLLLDAKAGWRLDLDRLERLLRPTTKLVAVNFPNNPTGAVPDAATFSELISLCDARGIRLFSDEIYRGLELNQTRMLPQAADLSATAISLNGMAKAYGLPGLRIGWLACRDHELLARLERRKHYTSICNAGPSELLATIALRNGTPIRERNRTIIAENLPRFAAFFDQWRELFEWTPPEGGCVCFPRYLGPDGVEAFCRNAVEHAGVLLLPASIYATPLASVSADRFRIGVGRSGAAEALEALDAFLRDR